MLLVWGIVNVVLLCLWGCVVGFARRGVDEGRRALRADAALTVLALVFVMAGTSLVNPSVREAVGSVIQTTTGGFDAPRTPEQLTNGLRATPDQNSSRGPGARQVAGGSVAGTAGSGMSNAARQGHATGSGTRQGGTPPVAANPVPPAGPSEPVPVPSPPTATSPSPSPTCGSGTPGDGSCPSPGGSPSPDAAVPGG
jgi:hypothetical protein